MQRTISIKLNTPKGFTEYLKTCNTIFNLYVNWCFTNKTHNKKLAHKELYLKFRTEFPTVPSAIIQTIRDCALEAVKAQKFKFKPYKKPYSNIRYDSRTVNLIDNLLTFSGPAKRIKQNISIPNFFRKRCNNWKFKAATIGYDSINKQLKANLTFISNAPDLKTSDKIVGVDRGLYNIITLSSGFKYSSHKIRQNKRKVLFLKRKLQAKGTLSAKRKLRKLSGYEKRFSLNINHEISKNLVSMDYDIFVIEDLKGIRKQKSKSKILNKMLSNWAFWQLEQLITYKAEALGKQVIKIDPRYTSQMCNNCGYTEKTNRNGSHFVCGSCGYREHADINAAKNIREKYIISIAKKQQMLAVTKKIEQAVESDSTVDSCQSAKRLGYSETSLRLSGEGN